MAGQGLPIFYLYNIFEFLFKGPGVKGVFIFVALFFSFQFCFAQKQLVLLKRENVVLRLYPGDEIILKLKNSKRVLTSYVNNIADTAVVIHLDTIPFHKIDRIYFRQSKFYNVIGGVLVIGGAGLFLIDQFNSIVVQGEKPRIDGWVTDISVPSIAVGLPLMLIKKKSQRIGYKYRLLMVQKGSPFFRPDARGFDSPYIPNN